MARFISKMLYIIIFSVHKKGVILSVLTAKITRRCKAFYTKITYIRVAIALSLILYGCFAPSFNVRDIEWETYKNTRYGFEFPYPNNWKTLVTPTNADGIAFVSPKNDSVEMRAWASNQLVESLTPQKSNFQTTQGLTGILKVEASNSVSSITLTLTQNQVSYNWRGRTPSQEFPDYYPLFYYIAQQYRVYR